LAVFAHRQPVFVASYGVVDIDLGTKELRLSRLYHADGVGERLIDWLDMVVFKT